MLKPTYKEVPSREIKNYGGYVFIKDKSKVSFILKLDFLFKANNDIDSSQGNFLRLNNL